MAKSVPEKRPRKPRTLEERVAHLEHTLERVERIFMATAAELTAAVAALTDAVAKVPAPVPQLITQDELDAATAGVTQATTDLAAKTPPTP
jgi:hypothetical protein